jgi:hypothetical protein
MDMNETVSRPMTEEERVIAQLGWTELTIEQKVERMCAVLRSYEYLKNQLTSLQARVFELEQHQHSANGEIVIPYGKKNQGVMGGLSSGLKSPYNKLF